MSTHDNNEHLIVFNYLENYLQKMIKEEKNNEFSANINVIRQETIIEILNNLEGK